MKQTIRNRKGASVEYDRRFEEWFSKEYSCLGGSGDIDSSFEAFKANLEEAGWAGWESAEAKQKQKDILAEKVVRTDERKKTEDKLLPFLEAKDISQFENKIRQNTLDEAIKELETLKSEEWNVPHNYAIERAISKLLQMKQKMTKWTK